MIAAQTIIGVVVRHAKGRRTVAAVISVAAVQQQPQVAVQHV